METVQKTIHVEGGRFRNKATGELVAAVRWAKDGDHPQVTRYPIEGRQLKGILEISPKERYHLAFGDWIVEDAEGKALYTVDAGRFAAQYEPAAQEAA